MKGFPPLEMLIVVALFVAALVPLLRLTGEHASPGTGPGPAGPTATTPAKRPQIAGTIRFSHPPTTFSITPDDQPATSEQEFFWNGHADGCEIHLTAAWPQGTPTVAVEVSVEPEGIPTQSRTLWIDTPLDEVVTFSWHPEPSAGKTR